MDCSKTLFLKSNLLHIRTNEGEFEVSNPEEVGRWDGHHLLLFILNPPLRIVSNNGLITTGDTCEWPGGVELIDMLQIRVGNEWKNLLYQKKYKGNMESTRTIKLARLLPKEEKKAESAYKEFEGKDLHIVTPESSEPQENRFNQALGEIPQDIKDQVEFEHNSINEAWELWGSIAKKDNVNPHAFVFGYVEARKKYVVSAPSESQEELLIDLLNIWVVFPADQAKERILKSFTITRLTP